MSITLVQKDIDDAVNAMCDAAQIDYDGQMKFEKDLRDQVIAFILALNKNYEREQQYQGLWKKDEVSEIGAMVSHKGKRLQQVEFIDSPERVDSTVDDALDAINYAAFAARKAHYSAVANNIVP
jgi:hypothetical protein